MRRGFGFPQLILALLFLASCDDDDTTSPSSTVETVAVIPGVFSLVVGDTLRLTTIARGDIGNPLVGRTVVWETSSPSVATVSGTGLVTAVGPGAVIINATIEGKVGTATVTVSPHFATADFASVSAGGEHTCALTNSGAAYCWGRGESGQLGVPPPVTMCVEPQPVACGLVPFPVGGGLMFERLSAGGQHTCGLTTDGSAWCWGSNAFGQLGDGSTNARSTPVAVATEERFTLIVAGQAHTCALTSVGVAWCWGHNEWGELGDGTTERRSTPVQVAVPLGVSFQHIAPGGNAFRGFTCGLASTGTAWCWGVNDRGQLGRGNRDIFRTPHAQLEQVSDTLVFAALAVRFGDHACGLTAAGAAYCWGGATSGELGDGGGSDALVPLAVAGGMTFVQMVTGGPSGDGGFTCGMTSSGAYCWGANTFGALGRGVVGGDRRPAAVMGGHQFASLSAGFQHTCGRTLGGIIYCWGSGRAGQLGFNYTTASALPVKVSGQP